MPLKSKKNQKRSFHFTPQTLLRLIAFVVIIYLAISLLSSTRPVENDPTTILGEQVNLHDSLKQKLPPDSRKLLDNLDQIPAIITVQEKFSDLQEQINGFPQKQIQQLKKQIIQNIYQDLMKSFDKTP